MRRYFSSVHRKGQTKTTLLIGPLRRPSRSALIRPRLKPMSSAERRKMRTLQLLKHGFRHQNPTEHLRQNVDFVYERQVVDGRGIGDDNHPSANVRAMARSCSRSASV